MPDRGFHARVASRDITIGVVGLGYVGLPLAIRAAETGFRSVGFDLDGERAERLNRGVSHVEDVADERVAAVLRAGLFGAAADPAILIGVDVVFICVPTPFDGAKTPDLSYASAATRTVASILRRGMLVILQSTSYPGTTVEIVKPLLEESGLRAGDDFHLAFSPERVDPGNAMWTVRNTPKVVGGLTVTCSDRAKALLEAVMDVPGLVTVVSCPGAAEMAKLLENTYRAVNIALVNEMAMLAHEMGLDIWEVIEAAATKPFGFQAFYPGVGPGGHCIPVDPYYLSWKAREFDFQTKFIELAADTNLRMANYVVARILTFMNGLGRMVNGSRVLCIGASFKARVSDTRNSRAIRVMEMLEEAGATVEYSDPLVKELLLPSGRRKSFDLSRVTWAEFDLVVVLVADPSYLMGDLIPSTLPVFDTVNGLSRPPVPFHGRL